MKYLLRYVPVTLISPINRIFYCFRDKSPASVTKVPAAILNLNLYALANPPKLPRSVLKDFLVFATKRSHFVFDGQYYDHIDGVAMGSPLGPVFGQYFYVRFRGDMGNE